MEARELLAAVSWIERAYCVGLVRLLRENYWLTEVVRQILDQEAQSKLNWSIKRLRQLLDNFSTLDTLAANAAKIGNNWSHHPVLKAVRDEFGDREIHDYRSDEKIRLLIESAHKK